LAAGEKHAVVSHHKRGTEFSVQRIFWQVTDGRTARQAVSTLSAGNLPCLCKDPSFLRMTGRSVLIGRQQNSERNRVKYKGLLFYPSKTFSSLPIFTLKASILPFVYLLCEHAFQFKMKALLLLWKTKHGPHLRSNQPF
jgi:hypothetical protein